MSNDPSSPPPPISSNTTCIVKVIVSLTLTLGWKYKKQPSGPVELDLEAGNLVIFFKWKKHFSLALLDIANTVIYHKM